MRPSVAATFRRYQATFEGVIECAYLDIEGLVTTAIGCKIDSIPEMAALGWVHLDMVTPATPDEIAIEWRHVKSLQSMRNEGGEAFMAMTTLRLTPAAVEGLLLARAATDEVYLRRRFEAYEDWPADAQMGVLSDAWAAGAAWAAPKFDAAARSLDFGTCSGPPGDANASALYRGEAWLRDSVPCPVDAEHPHGEKVTNPGLRRRNIATKVLFANAAASVADPVTYPPDTLYWPRALA